MKARELLCRLLVLAPGALLPGCQDPFSPKAPFVERPVVFCILHASNTRLPSLQEAVIGRTYDVEGVNPSAPHFPPVLTGAKLTIRASARTYQFTERVTPSEDSLQSARPGVYFHPAVVLYPLDTLSMSASLPDGRVLTARTFLPSPAGIESWPLYAHGFTTNVNRWTEGDEFLFDWDDGNYEEHLFFPSLVLLYREQRGTYAMDRLFEVPFRYVNRQGSLTPVFPSYQTAKTCAYPFSVIDEAMRQLGAGKPAGTEITVLKIIFGLTEFDYALSRYYASVNGYLDRYSVRTDESVYSNISGGIGIFGSRMDSEYAFPMDRRYVESFGYRSAGPN